MLDMSFTNLVMFNSIFNIKVSQLIILKKKKNKNLEWASMGTISTLKSIEGFPMVNIISVADSGRNESSTGYIYFLLTNLDFTGQDLLKQNKLTAMFSNDQDLECSKKGIDPMEPTCGRIMISGTAVQVFKLFPFDV